MMLRMAISVLEIFTIGIGPSSSHTVGPMRAARRFALGLERRGLLPAVQGIRVELFGSLGLTGKGHSSDRAILLGLEGETPERIDVDRIGSRLNEIRSSGTLRLLGKHAIPFREREHLIYRGEQLPLHPNGLRFTALDGLAGAGAPIRSRIYYSVGGGFVVDEETAGRDRLTREDVSLPFPFDSAADLLRLGERSGLSLSAMTLKNEMVWRGEEEIRRRLLEVWKAMEGSIERGMRQEGVLPGSLRLKRRAPGIRRKLEPIAGSGDPLDLLDRVNLYALAVNEENAAGGRVVTAPTNGAAGILPAVLRYYRMHRRGADDEGVVKFLLAAGAIGILYKNNASISGAEVGCQGEVGVACSMAAAGLTEALGGSLAQVENAAEIGMEHNLGLTCDPVGGLVQIPCIERNAMGAVKAINASRMALRGDGTHLVSLDRVIETMRQTGADMKSQYKETSRGGLAVNVTEC